MTEKPTAWLSYSVDVTCIHCGEDFDIISENDDGLFLNTYSAMIGKSLKTGRFAGKVIVTGKHLH